MSDERMVQAEKDALTTWLRERQTCEAAGHPAATFNPWMNQTWCVCGWRTASGDATSWESHVCGECRCLPSAFVSAS